MEIVMLLLTLVLAVYFVTTREIGHMDLLNEGGGMRFLSSYLMFTRFDVGHQQLYSSGYFLE